MPRSGVVRARSVEIWVAGSGSGYERRREERRHGLGLAGAMALLVGSVLCRILTICFVGKHE